MHSFVQTPVLQTWPWPQTLPQVPQFALSALVFAQYAAPPSGVHVVCPVTQLETQLPLEQVSCGPQEWPQVPQLALSARRLTQVPLQFVSPCWQLSEHTPVEQSSPGRHAWLHAPQFALSVC